MLSVYDAGITQSDVSADRNNKGASKAFVEEDSSWKRRIFQKSGTSNFVGMIDDSAQAVLESQGFVVQDESDSGEDANHVGDSSDSAQDTNLPRTVALARSTGSI